MTSMIQPALPVRPRSNATTPRHPAFSVPAKHNPRLQALVERIDADEELRQLWRCANLNASERCGLGDHGETHARIVANASLRLLRLLLEAGHRSGVVDGHNLTRADAEVVVVLAAVLHDIGLSVSVADPGGAGLMLARAKAAQLLDGLYRPTDRIALIVEILHAMHAHHQRVAGLTLESAVLTTADVLDLSKGRVGATDGEADDVESVHITRGASRPVRVEIHLAESSSLPVVTRRISGRLGILSVTSALEFVVQQASAPARHFVLSH